MQQQKKNTTQISNSIGLTILGCFGGMFIQLVIGSLYQWGIINIYVTSYYRLSDSTVTLENNVIAFPVMMMCIGLTMRLGLLMSEKSHPLIVLSINIVISAACIFIASYVNDMGAFIALYGIIFGLISGLNFMIPIVQCNRYYPGKKMYINGVILVGTGAGSVVFGPFSYNFLNPEKLRPIDGYYLGTQALQEVALKVPECLRWLSLLYLVIGFLGILMLTPVIIKNRQKVVFNEALDDISSQNIADMHRKQESFLNEQAKRDSPTKLPPINKDLLKNKQNLEFQIPQQKSELKGQQQVIVEPQIQQKKSELNNQQQSNIINSSFSQMRPKLKKQQSLKVEPVGLLSDQPRGYAQNLKQAFCSFICWYQLLTLIVGSVGVFLVNGNYKTYVKEEINDDEFLTYVGIVGAVGNGVSRFFWNLFFSRTGYKTVLLVNLTIQIIIYSTIRFIVINSGVYMFYVFLVNCCLGGLLVMAPTSAQQIFGQQTGSNIYGFYWCGFAVANFIQYAFVAGLSSTIGFDNIIYICLGLVVCSVFMVIFGKFQGPWQNKLEQLRYCSRCC